MKKLLIVSAVLIFAASATVQAENSPKAPAPKTASTDKDKTASCCDTDCDGKTVCKKMSKPVAMSPKAAAEAGKYPLIASK